MMETVLKKWQAGFVRRWHCNPDLAHTVDPTDGHSARVAKLALMIDPNITKQAIMYALAHDDGEFCLGDVSGLWKRENPDLAEAMEKAERDNLEKLGIHLPDLSDVESKLISLCDKIDAYLWMQHYTPHLSKREDWVASKNSIFGSLQAYAELGGNTQRCYWLLVDYFK